MSQEFDQGQALAHMLVDSTGLPLELVLDIAKQIGTHLERIHNQGRVHGALTPANILLTSDGQVQVLEGDQLSPGEEIAPVYRAPEVRHGGDKTPQADIYSFGITVYEALTGETPAEGAENPWPGNERPGLPPELDALVADCLRPDPAERVQNAVDLLNRIKLVYRGIQAGRNDTILGIEDSLVGYTLGSYQLVERLGQGGMAAVYKAYEPGLDRFVAVKVLPQFFARDPNFIHRFRREARAIAQLNHPNIVPIYNYGEDGGVTYLVMQYVEGGTLQQGSGVTLDASEAIKLVLPVARALAYAHKHGIIHRDIKPANVLLCDDDRPLLTDFGLVKMLENSTQLTKTGVGLGTPSYMSPEQGHGADADHRTDIYSLGIMLYEMLTGEVPFRAGTPMAVIIKHISAPMPMPRTINPDIPETLERIILKATAKSPEHRFQTAEEMAAALEEALDVLSASSQMSSRADIDRQPQTFSGEGRSRPQNRAAEAAGKASSQFESPSQDGTVRTIADKIRAKWRFVVLLMAFVFLCVLAGIFLLFRQAVDGSIIALQPSETATMTLTAVASLTDTLEPATATAEPATETPLPSPTETLSPTSTPRLQGLGGGSGQIAFASDRGGDVQIYLLAIDSGEAPRLLTEIPGGACQPAWSPDGTQLVVISPCESQRESYPDASLYLIDADGTNLTPLPVGSTGNYDPVWSLDGTRLVFTSLRDGLPQIYIYEFADQTTESISSGLSHDFQAALSPDGEQIAFISTRIGNPLIFTMSAQGEDVAQFSRNTTSSNANPRWSPDGSTLLYMQLNAGGFPILIAAPIEELGFSEETVISAYTSPMRDPAYSPDGTWVAFSSNQDGANHNIWIAATNGADSRELTSDPAYDFDPAWRP